MDPRTIRPESHVAQQSRRDKLRVQQGLNPIPQLDDYPTSLELLSAHPGLHPDLIHVRNVRNGCILYDPPPFSSQMLNFATNSNTIHQELGLVHTRRPITTEDSSFTVTSDLNGSLKASTSDLSGNGSWKSLDSPQSYDRMVTYANDSVGGDCNQKPISVGDVLSNNARISSFPPPRECLKPSNNQYQGVYLEATMGNTSCDISVKDSEKQIREMSFVSQSLCHNTLQDIVTSGSNRGNDRILPSSYGNQLTSPHFDNAWISRSSETFHQCSNELGLVGRKSDQERNIAKDASSRGLSLSLSSISPSRVDFTQFGERYEAQCLQSKISGKESQDSKFPESHRLAPMPKPSIISNDCGKSLNDIVGTSTQSLRSTGPLGPFTGYATILKSSRFLLPAQELLDVFCSVTSPKRTRECEVSVMSSGELSIPSSANAANAANTRAGDHCENNSDVSYPTFHSSNEGSVDCIAGSSSYESYWPEFRKKKARLLYLQEEVCSRYRQYQQQMQMVASSFESVAGLSAATPYVSLALRTVSRNFRSIKNSISDRLKFVMKALGEDSMSSNANADSGKGDMSISRLRYVDQSFQKHKSDGPGVGFLEPQQHLWRPQRGLPERSVAILRAWLFEHFLHPYPTDADKHMLAAQTGLSRNQVSNWFINARVRIWKPMVEEIHMLETKCLVETNQSSVKNAANSTEGCRQPNGDQSSVKLNANSMMNKHLECSGTGSLVGGEELLAAEPQWNQEKRSRVEFEFPTTIDGSLMNFLPYQRSEMIDSGGQGAVSLTLGLRHGVDNAQQLPQQLQAQENQFRLQFGGQMIHDFVG